MKVCSDEINVEVEKPQPQPGETSPLPSSPTNEELIKYVGLGAAVAAGLGLTGLIVLEQTKHRKH